MSMAIKSQGHVAAPKKGDVGTAKTKAIAAAKNLEEYLLAHYTMLRDYAGVNILDDRSELSFDDIVHYHVYGDYRLSNSQVLGPHIDSGYFAFTENELITADEDALQGHINNIEEHYDTTETVMSPLLLLGGSQVFRTVPIMRFKTTQYGSEPEVAAIPEIPADPAMGIIGVPGVDKVDGTPIARESIENRLALHLAEEKRHLDNLNGFFQHSKDDNLNSFVKQTKSNTDIRPRMSHWANKQLHAGTQALRFFLPSLGTMLVSGDVTKLAGYVGGRLEFTVDDIVDNLSEDRYNFLYQYHHREPQQLQDEYGILFNNDKIAEHLDNKDIETAPRIFYEWAKHICSHPDYIMYLEQVIGLEAEDQDIITACGGPIVTMRNTNPEPDIKVIRPRDIFAAAKTATQKSGMFGAGEGFIKELLSKGSEQIGVGTPVKMRSTPTRDEIDAGESDPQARMQQDVDDLDVGPDDDQDDDLVSLQEEFDSDATFYINSIGGGNYQVSKRYKDSSNTEYAWPMHNDGSGQPDMDTNNWFKFEDFRVFDQDTNQVLDEEGMREKDLGGKVDPLHKVFMRIAMDVYMTFETYASLVSNFVSFNKFSRFQGKNKDPLLRSPVGGGGGGGRGSSKAIGEFLVEQRLEITLGQLATQYATMRSGTTAMEEFYTQDLLGAEVQWLSSSISQFSPTLTQAVTPVAGNLLVQEMYIPPQGLVDGQEVQLQRVKPEVIFLKLDSALLRDIMIEYTRQQNDFVAATARQAGKKGKKNRKGQKGKNKNQKNAKILPTMWMLVKQQALSIAATENLKPHIMWNRLLDTVDKYRSELTMQYPLVPEHWATTFTVANLRKDPEIYGETVDEEQQRDLIIEYMNFLESTYYNSFTFVGRLAASLDTIRINLISDISTLQKYFVERLHQDSKDKILGRRFFPAYQRLLYIMRSFVDIPGSIRGEYSATVFDEEAREQMRSQMRGPRGSEAGQPIVASITDISPRQAREGQINRRPHL